MDGSDVIATQRLKEVLARRPRDGRHCAPAVSILLALLGGPRTASSLLDAGRDLGCAPFGHGTLFGTLARLEASGVVERLEGGRYRVADTLEAHP